MTSASPGRRRTPNGLRVAGALATALALGACASFSPDAGMGAVRRSVAEGVGKDAVKIATEDDARAVRARLDALLAEPLTADGAVQVALLANRGLQAAYNELGLAELAAVEAGLPPNPKLSLSRLAGGGVVELEMRIVANILALATLPQRRALAELEFAQAQSRAVEATFAVAIEARRAHVRAVAAQRQVALLEQARLSADAAASLMRRLGETGAATRLEQTRAAVFHAETSAQLAQARLRARGEREALARALGLWGRDVGFRLPAGLPQLPGKLELPENVEAEAVRRRIDLIVARRELEIAARALGLTEATRYVSLLELAGLRDDERERGEGAKSRLVRRGLELEIEIPLFDGGEIKVRRARETYMLAVNRLADKAIAARSDARAAQETLRATHDIARLYRGRILPLRRTVSEEVLLQYNGMLSDVLDLLADARERIASESAALDAERDYALAEIDFDAAIVGVGGPGRAAVGAGKPGPAAAASPAH